VLYWEKEILKNGGLEMEHGYEFREKHGCDHGGFHFDLCGSI